MSSVFFDVNALYIEGYRDSFAAGTLTFDVLAGNQIGIRVLHGTEYLVVDDWASYTRQDGTAFASVDDLSAYLSAQFAMRRPVGGIETVTAGSDIGGHKALMFAEDGTGNVVYADPTTDDCVFAGISLGAAAAGSALQTMTNGTIDEPSWSWEPLQPVYVAPAGVLTQSQPLSGFFHLIGFARTATSLLIAPAPLVQLA